jgi:DNA-binding CsgD family transcriptional regulator
MLVDRDGEIATLNALLHDCTQGHGTVAVIRGPVASGKTTLLRAFTERAEAGGATILSAVASRVERRLPLGILDQLFRASDLPAVIAAQVTALIESRSTLADLCAGPESESVTAVLASVFERLLKLLVELAEDHPLVIAVDDMQYADVTSLQCLSYLARRASASPILMVLTEGTQVRPADRLLHAELLCQGNCHRIPLTMLPPASMASLLSQSFNGQSQRLAPSCHVLTGGNPLLASALAEDSQALAGQPDSGLVPRAAFRSAVVTCLHRYEPWVVELAQAVAVLDGSATEWLLAELLEISPEAAAQGIDALSASGLFKAGRFRHEAARQAVLGDMTAQERGSMHARAARALYRVGSPAGIVAGHLVTAERIGAPWAVPVLQEAAEQALADGDANHATSYLRRAEIECTDERQQATIKFALACAEWPTDPECATRHLTKLAADARAGLLDGDCLAELAFYLLWIGDTGQASEVLARLDATRARTAVGQPGLRSRHMAIHTPLNFLYPDLARRIRRGGPGAPRSLSGQAAARSLSGQAAPAMPGPASERNAARPVVPPGAVPRPRSQPPHGRTQPSGYDGEGEATLAVAEKALQEHGRSGIALASVTTALMALIREDRQDRAAFWCDVLLRESEASGGSRLWRAVVTAFWGLVETRRGNLAAAQDRARTALTMLTKRAWGVAIGVPLSTLVLAATAGRRYEDAAVYLRMPVPEAMFETPYGLLYLYARADFYLATGRAEAALADFTEVGDRMVMWGLDHPGLMPWRAKAAETHLRLGNPRQARSLSQEQLARVGSRASRPRGMSLRALALASHPSKRTALLRESAEVLRESGARLELAYTLTELSNAHLALGEIGRAQWAARQARDLADQCGAKTSPNERLGADDDQSTPRRQIDKSRLTQLSDAERRVAMLAAYGYTNCQISSRLFITVSTVEQHLTRVYRKLGVTGREELPIEI